MATPGTRTGSQRNDRKRLAVFCDGTWNDLRMASLTNVARLAKCVTPKGWDGRRQIVFYDAGVGVATGVSPLVDRMVSVLGGALGRGIDEKIEAAYRFLVLNYEPGDEIFIFGFSRGAYTARSLVGLIRKCGIVRRDCFEQIPKAIRLYRSPAAPSDSELVNFRADYGARVPGTNRPIATGAEDLSEAPLDTSTGARQSPSDTWSRRAVGFAEVKTDRLADRVPPPDPPPLEIYRVMYVGLWDTVGSLGLPPSIPFVSALLNRRYRFHDTRASSLISSLRHACALDEDRKAFDVTEVGNIDKLNAEWARALGLQVDYPDRPKFVPYWDRPFQQCWFPGAHGAVGGGNPELGLSSGTLVWIAVGALRAGLKFQWDGVSELAKAKVARTPFADWRIDRNGHPKPAWMPDFLGFLAGYRDRLGPKTRDELSWAAVQRMEHPDGLYRPPTLKRFTGRARPTPSHWIVARAMGLLIWLLLIVGLVCLLGDPFAGMTLPCCQGAL
ncbi:MAG: DUF2235 domain-containing protein [Pseudomonadota bacterium]